MKKRLRKKLGRGEFHNPMTRTRREKVANYQMAVAIGQALATLPADKLREIAMQGKTPEEFEAWQKAGEANLTAARIGLQSKSLPDAVANYRRYSGKSRTRHELFLLRHGINPHDLL